MSDSSKIISIQSLKDKLDLLEVVQKYCEVKRINNNDYLAVNNPLRDEKTSSLHFYINTQKYYDYGSNESGDALDFISRVENISLSEVIERYKEDSDIPVVKNYQSPIREKPTTQKPQRTESEILAYIIRTIESFEANTELSSFKNPDYKKEALEVSPLWLYKEASKESLARFRELVTFDNLNNTIVIKIHNYLGELISFKRRRFNGSKWITAKGTHPNKQCLINNQALQDEHGNYKEHIYIVEGHHDYLTALLLGIDCLMIPTVTYQEFNDFEMNMLKNREVVFIPDLNGDDMSGVECMKSLECNRNAYTNLTIQLTIR